MAYEVKYSQLKKNRGGTSLRFKTTEEIGAFHGLIGQEKAAEALEFGLRSKDAGYNVYVSGQPGSGKTTFAAEYARKLASAMPDPMDLCYVYNYKAPRRPKRLLLPAGKGCAFREGMEGFITAVSKEMPEVFTGKEYENRKHGIVKQYQDMRDEAVREITKEAKARDYGVKMTNNGVYFMPIVNGEMITEEQYNDLPQEEKDDISKKTEHIQAIAQDVMHSIRGFERSAQGEVESLEQATAKEILTRHLEPLRGKFADIPEITAHLALVEEDVLENLSGFVAAESSDEEYLQSLMPWANKRDKDDTMDKYRVNLLTDNTAGGGAPVVVEFSPTYGGLVGEIEYDSEYGNLTTDFMKIKPGLLHKANGGFLILQARDVFGNPHLWDALSKCLITGKVVIEPLREYQSGYPVAGLRPEAVELNVKVALSGPSYYYDLLMDFSEEFLKLFKVNAAFDYEMAFDGGNLKRVAGFVKKFTTEKGSAPFERQAVISAAEHLCREAEAQDKLSTQLSVLKDILTEASALAASEKAASVTAEHVRKAADSKENRVNMYEEKLSELIRKEIITVDTEGSKVAQVNGLAVIDAGGHTFAKPARITATTYVGKAGVVNIEKEADMSGSIHDKGVQVIIGYLGQQYAQDFPLSLSCRVCFEQNYSGIDGDSASSAELYAIMSSLGDVPLRQDLAVTGSVSQRGEIQAVGGVTWKVEGFFALCKERGLTGNQGVIIPARNAGDLVLKDEVAEAVRDGLFHIYAISHVDEGIALLTGLEAGIKTEGAYPQGTIHGKVYKKLKRFYKKSGGA